MLKVRVTYGIVVLVVIALGLLSRKIVGVPLWVGDVLWALMVYLIVRTLFINAPVKTITFISITFCFAIEFSQLYQANWINHIRQTLPGRLILGQGFLWGDLLAYIVGVAIGMLAELRLKITKGTLG